MISKNGKTSGVNMNKKVFKRAWVLLVALVCSFSMISVGKIGMSSAEARISEAGNYLTEEELAEPIRITDPSGRVEFLIQQVSDGLNSERCVVSEENGFDLAETGPRDGVICLGDTAQYRISYNVEASDTPTTIRMQIPTVYENREGEPLVSSNGNRIQRWDLQGLNRVAEGGSSIPHTGVMSGNTMIMNFPASTSTASNDFGLFNLPLDSTWPLGIDQVLNLRAQFVDSSNQVIEESEGFPNPLRVVGTTLWDPTLNTINRDSPNIFKEDGETYYEYNIALRIQANSTGAIVYGAPKGAFNYLNQNARVAIDTSSFPEGSIIIPSNEFTTVEGNTVTYEKDLIGPRDPVRNTNFEVFTVRIPVSSLDPDQTEFSWNANISEYESTSQYIESQVANASPFINSDGFMGEQGYEPGANQSSDYDTGELFLGQNFSLTGVDYPNNNWARMNLKITTIGQWDKLIHSDENGESANDSLHSLGIEGAKFAGHRTWSEFGTMPYFGTLTNATYCDAWDTNYQTVDTDRQPKTQMRDDAGNWTDVPTTILYAEVNPGFNNNSVNSFNRIAQEAACSNEELNWTEEPTNDSNLVKVVFDGEYDALVSGADFVQRVQLPFKAMSNEAYKAMVNFPGTQAIYNTLVYSNNGNWAGERKLKLYYIRGEHLNLLINAGAGSTQNAGTTQYITGLGQLVQQNYLNNSTEPFQSYPVLRYEFSSGYSTIKLEDFIYEDYEVTIENADFGADGLPGTEDDTSPWVVTLRAKTPVTLPSSNNLILRLGDAWVQGTIPPYVKAGTTLYTKAEYMPDERMLELSDVPGDNVLNVPRNVNAISSMSQSKWALKNTEFAGNDVGWGISYSNTSPSDADETSIYDVLPYPGDNNGTTLDKPLTNIQFNVVQGDSDMRIEVTDTDPSTITDASIANGEITFIPLEDRDSLTGEITAFRIVEDTVEIDAIRLIQVTADTESDQAGQSMYNGLLEGSIAGLEQPMPATNPVLTDLIAGQVSGTIYYDNNNNGSLGSDETTRYEGTLVELVDSTGTVIDTTYSEEDGTYSFTNLVAGDYTVRVGDRGENVGEILEQTGTVEYEFSIDAVNNTVNRLDFGYWTSLAPSVNIEKNIVGYDEGASIPDGTLVVFEAVVTNDGDFRLDNIKVDDNVVGLFTCPETSLEPGESMVCSVEANYRATTVDDVDRKIAPGEDFNSASANLPDHDENQEYSVETIVHPMASKAGYAPGTQNSYTGAYICPGESFCSTSRIRDLDITRDGNIVAGWGDWNYNLDTFGVEEGRPSVIEYDPESKTWTDPIFTGSESIDSVKKQSDGSLYIPMIDPSDKKPSGEDSANISGFWTNESGKWELIKTPAMFHTLDAYKALDGTRFVAGSNNTGGVMYRQLPGSSDWEVAYQGDGGPMQRVYWIQGDNLGNIYFGFNGHNNEQTYQMKVHGDQGSATKVNDFVSTVPGAKSTTFNRTPYWGNGYSVPGKDLPRIENKELCDTCTIPPGHLYTTDYGEKLYTFSTRYNTVSYMNRGGNQWFTIRNIPLAPEQWESITAFSVSNDGTIYFGTKDGTILVVKPVE